MQFECGMNAKLMGPPTSDVTGKPQRGLNDDPMVWHPGLNGANSDAIDSFKATEHGRGALVFGIETEISWSEELGKAVEKDVCINSAELIGVAEALAYGLGHGLVPSDVIRLVFHGDN